MKRQRCQSDCRHPCNRHDDDYDDDDDETDTKSVSNGMIPNHELPHDVVGNTNPTMITQTNGTTTTTTTSSTTTTKNRGCLQTPHTMRLLKLIRDGTPEYANVAIERLGTYCATITTTTSTHNNRNSKNNNNTNSASSIVILWDLIGRLQSFLNVSIWSTRQLSSYAIYMVVAHYIPYMDQYQFFTSTIPSTSTTTNMKEYMTIQDLLDGIYSIENVLQYGEELYSVSESQYTTTVMNQEQTTNVNNTSHGVETNNNNDDNDDDDDKLFVSRRVRQQRQILASRLGLGMIASIVGASHNNNNDDDNDTMIPNLSNDDLLQVQSPSPIDTTTNKRQRHAQQIHQLQQQQPSSKKDDDHNGSDTNTLSTADVTTNTATTVSSSLQQYEVDVEDALDATPTSSAVHPNTIRAMLVREVVQQQQQQQQQVLSNHKSTSSTGSRSTNHNNCNPQTLFGTELLYRMFHPVWYIRHGALLGILALLRAWVHSRGSNSASDANSNNKNVFGTWLHDLLARCLCVIALDRFGDFGGNNNREHTSKNGGEFNDHMFPSYTTWSSNSVGSSVVAPVREVCGQAIAVLHAMAPSIVAEQTRAVLFQLCEYELAWEVRHGALITLKYIIVVELTNMLQLSDTTLDDIHQNTSSTRKDSKESSIWIETICRVAMKYLSDPSDDVKSASAHLLIELCRHSSDATNDSHNKKMLFVWDAVSPLWSTLQTVRRFSTCIVDLVELCTVLVARNCRSFLIGLHTMAQIDVCQESGSGSQSIYNLIQFLVSLLDSEFASVRISALQSIGVVCNELGTARTGDIPDDVGYVEAFDTMHDLAIQILKLFADRVAVTPEDIPCNDCEKQLSNDILFGTWARICIAINSVVKRNDFPKLDITLLSWYFQIGEKRVLVLSDVPIRLDASHALAYYLSGSSLNGTISDIAQTMMFAFVSSPWTTQVESVCLLHMELAKFLRDQASLREVESRISLEVPTLCLTSHVWKVANSIESLPAQCDKICLDVVAEVAIGSKTPRVGAEDISLTWSKVFIEIQSTKSTTPDQLVCPVTEMRLLTVLTGSLLVKGLPEKLTPVVRALMTFVHNEITSASRAELVATSIIELLKLIVGKPKYSTARTKIVAILCDIIPSKTRERKVNVFCSTLASSILQTMIKQIKSLQTLIDITPIWQRLQPIIQFDISNTYADIALLEAMDLLEVLLGGLSKKQALTKELIMSSAPALVELLLSSADIAMRKQATFTIVSICNVSPCCLLEVVIPSVAQELDILSDGSRRSAACKLLEKLVATSSTEISPYVRILLPRVLSLMSDSLVECSQCATGIFASLVKVAPLVSRSRFDKHDDNETSSVIDHLIFGKSLPPCSLPVALINAMNERGVTLRMYQQEGVSWLNFLQSVNLNGALCDGKGFMR